MHTEFVIMLARQRSGTNALKSVMNRHTDLTCLHEVFENAPAESANQFDGSRYYSRSHLSYFTFLEHYSRDRMRQVFAAKDRESVFLDYLEYLRCFSRRRYTVIDIKYRSAHHVSRAWQFLTEEPLLFDIIRRQGLRVLHLRRRNLLRYYVSDAKARAAGRWHRFDESVVGHLPWFTQRAPQPAVRDYEMHIDVADMLETLRLCDEEDQMVARSFDGYANALTIDYTDLTEGTAPGLSRAMLARVTNWLGLPDTFPDVRPVYEKQSFLPLDATIANYDEVRTALEGTRWAWCLEDEPAYRVAR